MAPLVLHISCQVAEYVCPQAYVWLHVPVHGLICLHKGCVWLATAMHVAAQEFHMAAQRLHVTAYVATYYCSELHSAVEGLHFLAKDRPMVPMQQICRICCIWLGRAGQQGFQETAQAVVSGRSWAP